MREEEGGGGRGEWVGWCLNGEGRGGEKEEE